MTTAIERDFETGDLRGTAPTVSQEQVGHGSYAMRVYNHRHNSPSPGRTEVRVNNDSGGRLEIPAAAGEVFVGVQQYVPADWIPDREGLRETVFQMHSLPYYKDGGPKQPPFALGFREDAWDIVSRNGSTKQWNPELDIGRWHNFVCRLRLTENNGLLQVYKDDVLVAGHSGDLHQDKATAYYFKFGLYKWSWKEKHGIDYPSNMEERLYYVDEIRIGSSYEQVAPPGSGPSPIPEPPPEPEPPPPVPDPDPDPDPDPEPDPVDLAQDERLDALEKWAGSFPPPREQEDLA